MKKQNYQNTPKKRGFLFWILAIAFFPISLSVWFYKTNKIKLDKKYRVIILAVLWIIIIAIGIFSPSEESKKPAVNETTHSVSEQAKTETKPEIKTEYQNETQPTEIIKPELTFCIDNVDLGEYGKRKTLNPKTDGEYTFIEYHIPAGKYKVTNNAVKGAVQVTVYSDEYVKNSAGWEEAKDSFDIAVISPTESATISISNNQHIKCADGETNLFFEKIG